MPRVRRVFIRPARTEQKAKPARIPKPKPKVDREAIVNPKRPQLTRRQWQRYGEALKILRINQPSFNVYGMSLLDLEDEVFSLQKAQVKRLFKKYGRCGSIA